MQSKLVKVGLEKNYYLFIPNNKKTFDSVFHTHQDPGSKEVSKVSKVQINKKLTIIL